MNAGYQSAKYRLMTPDGRQLFDLNIDALERLYRTGIIPKDTLVWEQPFAQSQKMEELAKLMKWDVAGENVNASSQPAQSNVTFTPTILGVTTPQTDDPRTGGMVAVAILLLINAVITVIGLALAGIQAHGPSRPLSVAIVWDVIIAVGLLRGKDAWKKWAMVRAVLGAVLWGVLLPLFTRTWVSAGEGVCQIVFSAGILLLLYGKPPSRERVAAGVITCVFAWLGAGGVGVASVLWSDFKAQNEITKQALPDRHFSDAATGVNLDLPSGWVLLPPGNSIAPVSDATLIAANTDAGCFAVLVVETFPDAFDSPDEYFDLVLKSRRQQLPSLKDAGRTDVPFGGWSGRRMLTTWTTEGQKFRGFNTVCHNGWNYYLLTAWAIEEAQPEAFEQFQALERSFRIEAVSPDESEFDEEEPEATAPPPPKRKK